MLPLIASILLLPTLGAQQKPLITLDEFMNATEIRDAAVSPNGLAAVIATDAPDWEHKRFKEDLWVWTKDAGLSLLTTSGHDSDPQWSPNPKADAEYVAFLSDRPLEAAASDEENGAEKDATTRVWLISAHGGEAFPLYREKLDAHAFAWTADGMGIYFSAADPLSKNAEEAYKEKWQDVIRWREQERGDVLLAMPVDAAVKARRGSPQAHAETTDAADQPPLPMEAKVIARSPYAIEEIAPSYAGDRIAFETGPVSKRVEDPKEMEMYLVPAAGGAVRQLTHNVGFESRLQWDRSGKNLFFLVAKGSGSIEGAYQDVQGRIYSLDLATLKAERLGGDFKGSWEDFSVGANGQIVTTGLLGVHQQLYAVEGPGFRPLGLEAGTYEHPHAARQGSALLFSHSTINEPTQVFLAASADDIGSAQAVTAFNPLFKERAQVTWKPYRWKSSDGMEVEGVLMFPPGLSPGKKDAKHLRMLTLIHGGPEDADGDHFGADWYDWAALAAANGWLVFRPNYRGSTGYGDAFMLAIQPHLVSGPGQDILAGVDALVKDGIADPDHLAIGGYSYGGYMTNWLVTQTTRFKAAVTGAGAVEHAANWGNDDLTFDDAWYLSGTPWEKPGLYQSEAALFQMNKVTTPTHIVGGNADVRVSYLEQVLLERALERLDVPHTLLVFPGENHPLDKDPWHGYIKVREELAWLAKYAGK